ncbi:MAG: hypothetical protein NTV62_02260 [Candidatus Gribaldobacteria bacterium]|nr:hypothetical protein [Candidatus Gribaldobacteria bacterium]
MEQLFNLRFLKRNQESKTTKKGLLNNFFKRVTRPFSLAKRLEHINNRGKKGRGN